MAYDLPTELFAELGIGMVIFGVRFYARWTTIGPRNWGLDDIFAGLAVVFWILEATFLYTCGVYGNNIGLDEKTALEVPDSEVPRLVEGSKHAYAAWIFYIVLIWVLKGVLLLLYNKLTMGLWQHKLAKLMMVISVLTFLASLFWHIFSCFPTYKAWQIKPFPGDACTLRQGNYIIITILDVVTDLGIIAIPLPMLLQSTLSLRRKLSLGILFSSGVFVMTCSIVRAYYSLANIESLTVALGWASREILVAAIVVCAPSIKPLVSQAKKRLTGNYGSGGSNSWKSGDGSRHGLSRINNSAARDPENITTVVAGGPSRSPTYKLSNGIGWSQRGESQDHINAIVDGDDKSTSSGGGGEGGGGGGKDSGIMVTHEFKVSSSDNR
ncbi:hypothetical protein F4778DRAFT_778344 [Xylariomycetidae sp. FL2044]|nr:hypothetical protein F4778DRAFT_778344 [Xylariomycetidae sp. FL2044]